MKKNLPSIFLKKKPFLIKEKALKVKRIFFLKVPKELK
jgi:hypothetical protein